MGDLVRVAVAQRFHDLDEDAPGVFLREIALGVEPVEQLSSVAEAA